jgi:hypothetical protein
MPILHFIIAEMPTGRLPSTMREPKALAWVAGIDAWVMRGLTAPFDVAWEPFGAQTVEQDGAHERRPTQTTRRTRCTIRVAITT